MCVSLEKMVSSTIPLKKLPKMQLEWQIPTFAQQVMKELGTGRSRGFGFVSVFGVDGGRWDGGGGVAMVYVYKLKLSKISWRIQILNIGLNGWSIQKTKSN